LHKVIIETDCDFSGCKFRKCTNFCEYKQRETESQSEIYDTRAGLSALIDERIHNVVWNKLYKRSLIETIAFEKDKCHEDDFWSYLVFARSKKYIEIHYIGYNYFQRETSIMGEKYSLKRLDGVEAKICRQLFLEERFPELASQAKRNLLFYCLWHGQLAITNLNINEKKYTLRYLKKIVRDNKMKKEDFKDLKLSHKVWLLMAYYSFEFTCQLRKKLHIGL